MPKRTGFHNYKELDLEAKPYMNRILERDMVRRGDTQNEYEIVIDDTQGLPPEDVVVFLCSCQSFGGRIEWTTQQNGSVRYRVVVYMD